MCLVITKDFVTEDSRIQRNNQRAEEERSILNEMLMNAKRPLFAVTIQKSLDKIN